MESKKKRCGQTVKGQATRGWAQAIKCTEKDSPSIRELEETFSTENNLGLDSLEPVVKAQINLLSHLGATHYCRALEL